MKIVNELCVRPYALIGFADGLPFAALTAPDGDGPALVTAGGWNVSVSYGDGITGFVSNAARVHGALKGPHEYEPHPDLDGTSFPTRDAADAAQYEAGVTEYLVYLDTDHYTHALEITGHH